MQRIAEDNWQIAADYPGVETRYIKGLKSKADVDDWLAEPHRLAAIARLREMTPRV